MRLFTLLSVLILGLLPYRQVHSQNAYITSLQQTVNFQNWPGQNGSLKQGFAFLPSDYPDLLGGYSIDSNRVRLSPDATALMRTVKLTNGTQSLIVFVSVSATSVKDAQSMLLNTTLTGTQTDVRTSLVRGDQNGMPVGDLSFLPPGSSADTSQGLVGFVRNNVVVSVSNGDPKNPSNVNLYELAKAIDEKIVSSPDLTPDQFNRQRPVISSLSPGSTSLQAAEGLSTPVSIATADPTGNSGPLVREFLTKGNLTVADTGANTVTVSPGSTLGSVPLQLLVYNRYLQFSTTTLTFQVTR